VVRRRLTCARRCLGGGASVVDLRASEVSQRASVARGWRTGTGRWVRLGLKRRLTCAWPVSGSAAPPSDLRPSVDNTRASVARWWQTCARLWLVGGRSMADWHWVAGGPTRVGGWLACDRFLVGGPSVVDYASSGCMLWSGTRRVVSLRASVPRR
jgi:hypothetical protein